MYYTWITGLETIKTAYQGYVWLYGCRQESVSAGLGCGLGSTPALSLMHSAAQYTYLLCFISSTTEWYWFTRCLGDFCLSRISINILRGTLYRMLKASTSIKATMDEKPRKYNRKQQQYSRRQTTGYKRNFFSIVQGKH